MENINISNTLIKSLLNFSAESTGYFYVGDDHYVLNIFRKKAKEIELCFNDERIYSYITEFFKMAINYDLFSPEVIKENSFLFSDDIQEIKLSSNNNHIKRKLYYVISKRKYKELIENDDYEEIFKRYKSLGYCDFLSDLFIVKFKDLRIVEETKKLKSFKTKSARN